MVLIWYCTLFGLDLYRDGLDLVLYFSCASVYLVLCLVHDEETVTFRNRMIRICIVFDLSY